MTQAILQGLGAKGDNNKFTASLRNGCKDGVLAIAVETTYDDSNKLFSIL